MIKKNTNIEFSFLLGLIVSSFILRLITSYYVHDTHMDNEWAILLENLIRNGSYSFYAFNGQLVPSVYMPPMYPFFLYLISFVTSFENTGLLYSIIFIQIILSTYSVYLFYQINQNFFSNKVSLINSIVFSIIPLNIYACGQISSINLQIVLSLLFIKLLLLIVKKETLFNIINFSIVCGLLILTRGEFILIFCFIIFFIVLSKKIRLINLVKVIIIVLLVISPYVIRNFLHFNQIIVVKSLGYNLWKGNNVLSPAEGYENLANIQFAELNSKLDNIKRDSFYEINRDDIFLKEATSNINDDFSKYLKLSLKKFFTYYFIDINSTYPNYYNFFHVMPIVLLSVLSFPGLLMFYKKKEFKNKCLLMYLFLNLIIFSAFFILPRYKLIILPIQIILASYFILQMLKKFSKN